MQFRTLSAAALIVAGAFAFSANAATVRWSSQADYTTFDIHGNNEGNTHNGQQLVYEALTTYTPKVELVPCLATSWKYDAAKQGWFFTLRQGVKFHEGETMTADDVVWSLQRAMHPKSNVKSDAGTLVSVEKVDDKTVFVKTTSGSPVTLRLMSALRIMCKSWAEKHHALEPADMRSKDESYTNRHENGTGPYVLASREPDVKTVFKRFNGYWNPDLFKTTNVDEVIYTPIKSAATRTAALISGQLDIVLDPAPQDLPRIEKNPATKVIVGLENRIIYLAPDVFRQSNPYILVDGKTGQNPFLKKEMRQALYQAIDINAIQKNVMRGMSHPTGSILAANISGWTKELDARSAPYDLKAAKDLMAKAGYKPGQIEFTLDCSNNRYVNDENICKALVSMWAKLGIKVHLNAMPKTTFFPKVKPPRMDSAMSMLGYGTSTFDAMYLVQGILASFNKATGDGYTNGGGIHNARIDELVNKSKSESDPDKRLAYLREACQIAKDDYLVIPLHIQMIPWAMSKKLEAVQFPNNRYFPFWSNMR